MLTYKVANWPEILVEGYGRVFHRFPRLVTGIPATSECPIGDLVVISLDLDIYRRVALDAGWLVLRVFHD